MRNYIITSVAVLALVAAGCEKKQSNFVQGYDVEYSNQGYYVKASFKRDKEPAFPEVTMNGSTGQQIYYHFEWLGKDNPDLTFSAKLSTGQVVNTITLADAPAYNVYMPDTFSISKGGWFVFNQATQLPGEFKQFWLGPKEAGTIPYYSENTPNDTIWVPLAGYTYLNSRDSALFGFGVVKNIALKQADGNGDGSILITKALKKWVQLVP